MLLGVNAGGGPRYLNNLAAPHISDPNTVNRRQWIIATKNHPFFSNRDSTTTAQWTETLQLTHGDQIELFNDRTASVGFIEWIYHSRDSGIGFAPGDDKRWDHGGYYVDLDSHPTQPKYIEDSSPGYVENLPPVTIKVYNIEVQDNHTYYAGEIGLWVRDKNNSRCR